MQNKPDQFGRTALEHALADPPLAASSSGGVSEARAELVLELVDSGAVPFRPAATAGDAVLRELDLAAAALHAPESAAAGRADGGGAAAIAGRLAGKLAEMLPGAPEWVQVITGCLHSHQLKQHYPPVNNDARPP